MPRVVAYSGTALTLLDLKADQPDFAEYYSGNKYDALNDFIFVL